MFLISLPLIILLVIQFVCAIVISFCVVKVFNKPISAIFKRIIQDEISLSFTKYVKYATYFFGISGGLIGHLSEEYMPDKYLSESTSDSQTSGLDDELMSEIRDNLWFWMMCGLIIGRIAGTLHAVAQMYLVLFVIVVIAYIAVKILELRENQSE